MDPRNVIKLAVPVVVSKHACTAVRFATEKGGLTCISRGFYEPLRKTYRSIALEAPLHVLPLLTANGVVLLVLLLCKVWTKNWVKILSSI